MEVEEQNQNQQFLNLDTLFEMLGNPTRRVILAKLAKVPLSASELAKALGISRQAVHSQLKILSDNRIIENLDPDSRGGKFRIKSNLSLRIDLTPDYYNVEYNIAEVNIEDESIQLKDIGCQNDYERIKKPNEKLRFLGEKIKNIEKSIRELEEERNQLLQNKECLIIELKNVMKQQYENQLWKGHPNLEKEIFFTLFYNPIKYLKKINIDTLLEDMFFSDMDLIRRDQHRVSIQHLLRDLSKFMDFLHEDEDDWFFDI
ncbi:MAG: ArsR/SmtB family transcription factor [Promethearchaeota archaeon]